MERLTLELQTGVLKQVFSRAARLPSEEAYAPFLATL